MISDFFRIIWNRVYGLIYMGFFFLVCALLKLELKKVIFFTEYKVGYMLIKLTLKFYFSDYLIIHLLLSLGLSNAKKSVQVTYHLSVIFLPCAFALCIFYITVSNNCHPLLFFLCVLKEILFIPKVSFSGIKSVLWYFSYGFKFCHCNFIFNFFCLNSFSFLLFLLYRVHM